MELYFALADVYVSWPLLLLLGLCVGTMMGFFGVGGGWLSTPSLNILGFPMLYAIGTGLAYVTGSAIMGTVRHYRLGNLDLRLAGVLGISGVAGTEVARRTVFLLEEMELAESYIRIAYVVLLFGVGLSIAIEYLRGRRPAAGTAQKPGAQGEPATVLSRRVQGLRLPPYIRLTLAPVEISLWVLAIAGFGVGMVAGFMGVGGGFIMVPMMVYVLGVPTRVAVGSSLFSIVLTSSYGALSYGASGRVEVLAAFLLFLGATVGAQMGATATLYVTGKSLRVLLAASLLLAGLAVALQHLGLGNASMGLMFGTALALTATIFGLLVKGLRRAATKG